MGKKKETVEPMTVRLDVDEVKGLANYNATKKLLSKQGLRYTIPWIAMLVVCFVLIEVVDIAEVLYPMLVVFLIPMLYVIRKNAGWKKSEIQKLRERALPEKKDNLG